MIITMATSHMSLSDIWKVFLCSSAQTKTINFNPGQGCALSIGENFQDELIHLNTIHIPFKQVSTRADSSTLSPV